MAKKVKEQYDAPVATGEMKPCLYLDFQGKDAKQLTGVAVGEKVEILITGTVKGVSQREREDYDHPKKVVKTGTIDLTEYKVKILEEEDNPYTKMAEED